MNWKGICVFFALLLSFTMPLIMPLQVLAEDSPDIRTGPAEIDASRLPPYFLLKNRDNVIYCALTVFVDAMFFQDVHYEPQSRSLLLTGQRSVRIRIGEQRLDVNDVPVQMEAPVILVGEEIYLPADSFASLLGSSIKLPESRYVRPLVETDRKRQVLGSQRGPALSQGQFFRQLIRKRIASKEDVCRAVALLLSLPEALGPYESLLASVKQKGVIPASWKFRPQDPATQGFACFTFIRALGVKGGLSTRILGFSGRTAYREAVYLNLTTPTGDRTRITGGELIAILQKASKIRREK